MASKRTKTKTKTYALGPDDRKLTYNKQALLARFMKGDSEASGLGVVWTSPAPENKAYYFPVMQLNSNGTYKKATPFDLRIIQGHLDSQNHADKTAFLRSLARELKNTGPFANIKLKDIRFLSQAATGKLAPASAAVAAAPAPVSASQAPTQEQIAASQAPTQEQKSPPPVSPQQKEQSSISGKKPKTRRKRLKEKIHR